MDKLKNLLKSDTPTDDQTAPSGVTGKVTGQGSHFPHNDQSTSSAPTTVTGSDPETRGPSDVSAVKPDPVQASLTGGPESGGSKHVNTIPAKPTTTSQSTGGDVNEAQSYNVTNADFPKTTSSADGSGTAAIGSTTTYKSSHLPSGDPVSSIIDKDSSDPLTYKKPESGAGPAGVGPGAATAAATTAFSSSPERGPGHENPYKTASIDPRVDGGSKTAATEATLAGAGATTAARELAEHRSAQAPSTLTTTTDPIERSTVYSPVTSTQGLDEAKATTTTTKEPAGSSEGEPSVVSKALEALGLGGIAGTAAAKLSSDKKESAIDDTAQPTTTTGVSSYTAPTEQGPGSTHHRKESIPTTAYPAGLGSPGAINAPVGGTRATTDDTLQSNLSTTQKTSDTTTSHTAALAGAGAGAAVVGAAAVGAHEYSKKEAEKAEAEAAKQQEAQHKAIEEQQKAAQKQAEEQQKAAQKQAEEQRKHAEKEQKAIEKEEKAHQKAVEKEEKKHQKELEKEEKKHEKEVAAAEKKHEKEEKERQKQLEKEEEERQKQAQDEEERRRKTAAAAGAATAVEHEKDKDVDKEQQEKKPSLFKRIFKRRKNAETGEEEEYESDEEHHTATAIAGGSAVGAGATGAAVLGTREEQAANPTQPPHTEPTTLTQTSTTQVPVDPLTSTQPPSQTGAVGFVSTGEDGKPTYTLVPQAAPQTASSDIRTTDNTTGLPHDTNPTTTLPSREHGEATSADVSATSTATATDERGHTSLQDRIEAMTHENFGVIEDHHR